MVGGNASWCKKKLAYVSEVANFRKQSERTCIMYFKNDAIGFDDLVPNATSSSQSNNNSLI